MKNKLLSIFFVTIIFGMMILSIIIPDKTISISERRKLASFPSINLETIVEGSFFSNLNNYLVEQFPFREFLRNIKGFVSSNFFLKKDEDGVFIENGAIYQLSPEINYKSVYNFTNLLNKVKTNYLESSNIYYSVIPDKNYFLDNIPKLDYNALENTLKSELPNMNYINLFDVLSLDSYYKTDIHWKQEKLAKVVDKIESSMNLEKSTFPTDSKKYDKFYGTLYGRIANNIKPDEIIYLTNDYINNATVFDYESNKYINVYEEENLSHIDPYDIYLSGARALLIIENTKNQTGKELIIFRDSFASSITPLLISNYSKITMIDLRYINSNLLDKIDEINLNGSKDVLFLYSVPVINNSFTLK